jgi:predicted DNA-binding protein
MDLAAAEENRERIRSLLDDEADRTRAGFSLSGTVGSAPPPPPGAAALGIGRDPDLLQAAPPANKTDADFVREIIPELRHMSDAYLTQHSIDRLQKYVHMLKKHSEEKKEKNIEARLAQNLEEAIAKPVRIPAHDDNRSDILHPARFLPGAAISMEQSWLSARKQWGREAKLAVSEFDLLAIGLPGCIPSRAWEILHFPGSRELSLKLFTVANVARASEGARTVTSQSEDRLVLRESLKELTEMAE